MKLFRFTLRFLGLLLVVAAYLSTASKKRIWLYAEDFPIDDVEEKQSNNNTRIPIIADRSHQATNTTTVLAYTDWNMTTFVEDAFRKKFCSRILRAAAAYEKETNHSSSTAALLVNDSFSCQDVYANSGFGTGNFLTSIYILKSYVERLGNVQVVLSCSDANQQKSQLILPWLMGWFSYHNNSDNDAYNQTANTTAAATSSSSSIENNSSKELRRPLRVKAAMRHCMQVPCPLAERLTDIRYDLRRMAVALVGIPSRDHPSFAEMQQWLQQEQNQQADNNTLHRRRQHHTLPTPRQGDAPILSNVQLDDAVIHFRCGDLIDSNEPHYGFMKFDSYTRHISPAARSIGIVTESFDTTGQHRRAESRNITQARCRTVVQAFVEHLQGQFLNATIQIRNDANETVPLAYARIIMANQTVVPTSTFAVFAALASFAGQAFVRKSDPRAFGGWLVKCNIQDKLDNVILIDEPDWLEASKCQKMWGTGDGSNVLAWFRSPVSSSRP